MPEFAKAYFCELRHQIISIRNNTTKCVICQGSTPNIFTIMINFQYFVKVQ